MSRRPHTGDKLKGWDWDLDKEAMLAVEVSKDGGTVIVGGRASTIESFLELHRWSIGGFWEVK